MLYHRPLLPNGRQAPIAWEIQLFFLNVSWPIKENASKCMAIFDKFIIGAGFIMFCYMNEAEMHFMVQNISDIGLTLEACAPYLILIECHLRIFGMSFRKSEFKRLIDDFYHKIYFENTLQNRKIFQDIQRKLWPTKLCSYFYILTLFSYFAAVIWGFAHNLRLVPFKTAFHYSFDAWYSYFPTLFVTMWVGWAVVAHLVAESNMLATIILHLDAKYVSLQQDLRDLHELLLNDKNMLREKQSREFQRRLVAIIKHNIDYNEFTQSFKNYCSFLVFVTMALSAVLLCVLGFKAATLGMTTKNITFVTWIMGKIVELLVFGTLGSNFVETTNRMSTSYYACNWENIICNSHHTKDNVELMKLMALVIQLNKKPFAITGFDYFSVSLETVVSILQGAFSYFGFLYAFR